MELVTSCVICSRPSRIRVCAHCTEVTDRNISEIPSLYRSLAAVLAPGAGSGDRVSGSRTPPLPVRLGPLTLRSGGSLVAMLHSWEDDWRDLLGWTKRPFRGTIEQSVIGTTKFLRANWPWAADKHPAPEDFSREIRDVVSECRTEIDGKGDSRQIGLCPADVGEKICGSPLWASPYSVSIKCRRCGTEWAQDAWLKLAGAIHAAT